MKLKKIKRGKYSVVNTPLIIEGFSGCWSVLHSDGRNIFYEEDSFTAAKDAAYALIVNGINYELRDIPPKRTGDGEFEEEE